MSDWEEIKARILNDADEMDGNPVSFDKAAASGVAADIRAALERVERLEGLILDWTMSFSGSSHEYQLATEALAEEANRIRAAKGE